MPAFAGPLYVFSGLIVVAGAMKIVQPSITGGALRQSGLPGSTIVVRALGAGEIAIGLTAIATGSPASAWLVAIAYAGFTAFVVNALVRDLPVGSCGCFGKEDTPPTWIHVGITGLGAGFAVAASGKRGRALQRSDAWFGEETRIPVTGPVLWAPISSLAYGRW